MRRYQGLTSRQVSMNFLMGRSRSLICSVLMISGTLGPFAIDAPALPQGDAGLSLASPMLLRWEYSSEATLNLTPTADGDRIFLPLAAGAVIAICARDGRLIWRTDTGGEFSASPVADERAVYLPSDAATDESSESIPRAALRALSRLGGITLWIRRLPGALRGSLAENVEAVFGAGVDGQVYAFKKLDGAIVWRQKLPGRFESDPLITSSRLYLGSDEGSLYALDLATGAVLWRYQTRGVVRARPVAFDGTVFFGSADGNVYALGENDGHLKWHWRTGGAVEGVAEAAGGVIAASLDDFVYYLSPSRGELRWKHLMAGRLASQPFTTTDGALLTPLAGSSGVVLDLRTGKQINSLTVGEDAATAAAPIRVGNLLVMTTRHGLMAFSSTPDQVRGPANCFGR